MRFLLPTLLATTALHHAVSAAASSVANSPLLSRVTNAHKEHMMDVLPTMSAATMPMSTVLPTALSAGMINNQPTVSNPVLTNSTVGVATQSVATDFSVFPGQNDGES